MHSGMASQQQWGSDAHTGAHLGSPARQRCRPRLSTRAQALGLAGSEPHQAAGSEPRSCMCDLQLSQQILAQKPTAGPVTRSQPSRGRQSLLMRFSIKYKPPFPSLWADALTSGSPRVSLTASVVFLEA